MKGQGRDQLLLNIVAPTRSIQPNYLRHVLETWDGEVHDGIVAARTPSSITLRRALGEETVLLAARVKSDRTTNASLMPEGLLFGLSPEQIADLLAFLTAP